MGKIIAAALIAVIAIEPLRFQKERHMPGARVEGLPQESADALIAMGHARLPTAEEDAIAAGNQEGRGSDTGSGTDTGSADGEGKLTDKVDTPDSDATKTATAAVAETKPAAKSAPAKKVATQKTAAKKK